MNLRAQQMGGIVDKSFDDVVMSERFSALMLARFGKWYCELQESRSGCIR